MPNKIHQQFSSAPSVYAALIPSCTIDPFRPPQEAAEGLCSVCRLPRAPHLLHWLRFKITRNEGTGNRRACLECIIASQPFFSGDVFVPGTLLAIYPGKCELPGEDTAGTNKAIPIDMLKEERKRIAAQNKRALAKPLSFALVHDVSSEQNLHVYTWSVAHVSFFTEDILARSTETGNWWSLNLSDQVQLMRYRIEEEHKFKMLCESARLRH